MKINKVKVSNKRKSCDWSVGLAITRSSVEREDKDSNLGPVKSDTLLPTVRHCSNLSPKWTVLPGRNDAEMGPAYLLHALV